MGIDKDMNPTAATELRRQAEERLQVKMVQMHLPRTEEETQRLVHELEVHQIELEMQNEEFRQSRDDTAAALDKYADLYDFAPVGYFILDQAGIIHSLNLTGASFLGEDRSRLLGLCFGHFVAEEDYWFFSDFIRKVFVAQANESCEVALRKKGDSPLYVRIMGVTAAMGQECRIAVIDITERKLAEEELRQSSAKLQSINAQLIDSRRAALNIMEDASFARRQAEEANEELQHEVKERQQAEAALLHANDVLEMRVRERTEELATSVETLLGAMAERERAERSLQRLNRLYAVLSETNQAIVRATDRDVLFQDVCRIAVEHGGFILSLVGVADEKSGQVRIMAADGDTAYLDDIRITAKVEPAGEGPTGSSIREGTYFICNDFQNDPCTRPWHEKGRDHGIFSSASIALTEGVRVIGAFTLYAGEKDFFDQQHVALLQQMGEDISFALENFTREAHRREMEQSLREETLERLRAVEALREKEQMFLQQSRLAAMGEMINNIAHQWRQPLNNLALTIQSLLLFYDLGDFNREFLQKNSDDAMKMIRHMSCTIDDFRNFFRTDKEKTDFSVQQSIQLTLSLIGIAFKNNNIAIDTHIDGNPLINGYYNEFSQVLLNILQNASDVLTERKISGGKVAIVAAQENGRTVVTITDNAGGIPEKLLDRIFEPYFSTKGVQGTGIGLFMSKNIIETNMGGSITARNRAEGAEFRIEI